MVPVLVAAVLAFGLLFIGVIKNSLSGDVLSDTGSGVFCTSGDFMVKYCIEGSNGSYNSRLIIGNDSVTDNTQGRGNNYAITFNFSPDLSNFV